MNKQQLQSYEAPIVQIFDLRIEGVICYSPTPGRAGSEEGINRYEDDF